MTSDMVLKVSCGSCTSNYPILKDYLKYALKESAQRRDPSLSAMNIKQSKYDKHFQSSPAYCTALSPSGIQRPPVSKHGNQWNLKGTKKLINVSNVALKEIEKHNSNMMENPSMKKWLYAAIIRQRNKEALQIVQDILQD